MTRTTEIDFMQGLREELSVVDIQEALSKLLNAATHSV